MSLCSLGNSKRMTEPEVILIILYVHDLEWRPDNCRVASGEWESRLTLMVFPSPVSRLPSPVSRLPSPVSRLTSHASHLHLPQKYASGIASNFLDLQGC